MHNSEPKTHEEFGIFQIVILILSFIVLGALVADTAFTLPPAISSVLQKIDTLICIVFLADFGVRFYQAKSKLAFLKWGWIDLVASIPNVRILRWARLVRVLQIIRLLRAMRATHKLMALLLKNRFQSGFASIVLTALSLIIFSSVGILICERQDPQANIVTGGDAIWWSVTTITTVGYGDKYPVTAEGRIIAMMLMVSGMGLFGGLSGLVASVFVGSKEKKITEEENRILARLEKLEGKIDSLRHNDS